MVTYYQQLYPHISIALINERKDDLFIRAHQTYFKRAIQNILANAMRYAQTKVTVEYKRLKDDVIIEISDDGPVRKQQPTWFERLGCQASEGVRSGFVRCAVSRGPTDLVAEKPTLEKGSQTHGTSPPE